MISRECVLGARVPPTSRSYAPPFCFSLSAARRVKVVCIAAAIARSRTAQCQSRLKCNPSQVQLRSSSTARCVLGSRTAPTAPTTSVGAPKALVQHARARPFLPSSCRPRNRSSASTSRRRPAWLTSWGWAPGRVSIAAVCWRMATRAQATQPLDVSGTVHTAKNIAVPSVKKQTAAASDRGPATTPKTMELLGVHITNNGAVARP